ncbi:MAG: hypothetical protein HY646_14210, partial [Acidobacteria bacterium]|nr:hypothetical protein [Acidobacteriota bacterium]
MNPPGETIHSFDAFRGNPDILYGHDFSRTRRVHRSSDGGTTWTATPAGFFGTLRIHPTNSQIVIYTGDRAKITKTTDGFATFRHVYEDPELPPN